MQAVPPGDRGTAASTQSRSSLSARLLANSLLLYLLADAAGRVWVVLNSDVGQLLRRLH
jgi:hypothetical protein